MLKKEAPNFDPMERSSSERDQIADALSLFLDKGPKNEAQSEANLGKCGHPQATPNISKEPRPRKKSSGTYLDSPPNDPRTTNGHQEDESDETLAEPEMAPDRESPSKPRENILNHRPLFD